MVDGPHNMFDFSAHEKRVIVPLVLAGFFENYDTSVLTIGAPAIAAGLDVSVATFGIGVAIIRLAALGSVPVLRVADRWGRRLLLILSLALFTLATGATALAWSLAAFVAFQIVARIFLATENTLASLVIAEEVRADRRGAGLSLLGMVSGIGGGAVALLLLAVPHTPLGWRLFYLFALMPLVIVAYLRRNLRETVAFEVAQEEKRLQASFWPRVSAAYRGRLWLVVAVVAAFGAVQTPAFFYASELAQDVYGWKSLFTTIILASGLFGFLGFYLGGRISDLVGRRPITAAGIMMTAAGTILIFTEVRGLFAPGWFLLVAALATLQAVSLAYFAELFPTQVRATLTAFVISCQVAAGSIGLLVLGALAGVLGTSAILLSMGFGLFATVLLLIPLPETRGADVVHETSPDERTPGSRPAT